MSREMMKFWYYFSFFF